MERGSLGGARRGGSGGLLRDGGRLRAVCCMSFCFSVGWVCTAARGRGRYGVGKA